MANSDYKSTSFIEPNRGISITEDEFPSCISSADLLERVSQYMTRVEVDRVNQAYLLAYEAHDGVIRKSGEAYIFHPIAVAYTLADLQMDLDTIQAALLHDVIEDTEFTKQDLRAKFGDVVADLVDGVTKLAGGIFTTRDEAAAASFQKMMAGMTHDYRVVLIKLADRLHNVKTLGVRKPASRRRIARETLDIHVPLARRMGMNTLRKDLQLNAFKHLYPWRSKRLEKSMQQLVIDNQAEYEEIFTTIKSALKEKNIEADVFSWEKNIYKLYKRIKKGKNQKQISKFTNSLELRVLVKSSTDCYTALGVVHQLFHPKVGSFKDFIATPKGYGFQALQTALVTPQRQLIFVQIQSHEMFKIAQYGITASTRYPELLESSGKSKMYLDRWLKQVEEIQSITGTAAEFLEDMKADLFLSEIYVSTPRGEVKVLPKGSTPIDFAYSIHTQVGNKCVSALIDGDLARLNARLSNGATVLILTDNDAAPSPNWLNFAVTAKARSSIRSWLKKRKTHEFIELGEKMLNKALLSLKTSIDEIPETDINETLKTLNLDNKEALFSSIANGDQSAKLVAKRLAANDEFTSIEPPKDQLLLIKGTEGLAVNLQKCCYPIPNDSIVAHANSQSGLEVHRDNCPNLPRNGHSLAKDIFSIAWVDDISKNPHFLAALNLQVKNQVGVLSHITDTLEKMNVNIEDINISGDKDMKDMYFLIQIKDGAHFKLVSESLQKLPQILDVIRVLGRNDS